MYLHTILQRQTAQGSERHLKVDLPPGATVDDLLTNLEIQLDPEHLLLVVNGRVAELDQVLQDGDQVNLMPALSGG